MRIVFLDFDGVLRCQLSYSLPEYLAREVVPAPAHPDCVAALNRIIVETDARVVVSSLWREGGLKAMRRYLVGWGVRCKVVGCTPDLSSKAGGLYRPVERGTEIQAWLDAHPIVESFVILDDDADMAHLAGRLIQTEFERGLTQEHAARAVEMLKRRTVP